MKLLVSVVKIVVNVFEVNSASAYEAKEMVADGEGKEVDSYEYRTLESRWWGVKPHEGSDYDLRTEVLKSDLLEEAELMALEAFDV